VTICEPPTEHIAEPYHWIRQGGDTFPAMWDMEARRWKFFGDPVGLSDAAAGEAGCVWYGVDRHPALASER